MAAPFGDETKGPGGTGKRPAATIEGTATEVSVEPHAEAASAEEGSRAAADEAQVASAGIEQAEPDETEAETGVKEPPPPRRSRFESFVTHLTAGLLGGLAGAAVLAFAWGYLPSRQSPQSAQLTSLGQRVAKLESAEASSADKEALAKLEARVGQLETREPETLPEVSALADRVSQLEASLKSLAEAAKQGGSVSDGAAISQQISATEQRLQAKIDAGLAGAKTANNAALADMKKEIAEVDAKLKALTEAELGSGDTANLGPEISVLEKRVAKIESALGELADAIDKSAADMKAATLAIAFANLRAAVDEGRPYATELDTLVALSPSASDLGTLANYDEKGIPTVAELRRSFNAAKDAALATPAPLSGGSILDHLMTSAQSLVKIKRVDASATGDEPSAVLARAEAAIDQDDLAGAVKEVGTLSGVPRTAFSTWLDQADARLAANGTLDRLESALLVSIGESGGSDEDQPDQEEQKNEPD
jgi:hypothetical protein